MSGVDRQGTVEDTFVDNLPKAAPVICELFMGRGSQGLGPLVSREDPARLVCASLCDGGSRGVSSYGHVTTQGDVYVDPSHLGWVYAELYEV